MTDDATDAVADRGSATSPTRPPAEEEVTRREFARYLVARRRRDGRRQRRHRRVDPAAQRSTPANRAPIVALDDVAVGGTYLFRYPGRRRPGDPRCASPTARSSRSARSAPTSAASSTTRPTSDRWHCPCHEGNFDARTGAVISGPPTATARPHRRRGPRRRHDLGARAARREDVAAPRPAHLVGGRRSTSSSSSRSRCSWSPSPSRRSRPTTSRSPGRPPRVSVVLFAAAAALPALPATMTAHRDRRPTPRVRPDRDAVPRLLRARHGHRHHRHRRRSSRTSTGSPTVLYVVAAVAYVVLAVLLVVRLVALPAAARRRPHQPRQGLRVPHHRRRHQRARQRLGAHPRLVDPRRGCCGGVSLAAVGRARLHHADRRRARGHDKPGLGAGINGTWFLLTVSTESIAVLGALLLGRDAERLPRLRLHRRVHASASCST